MNLLKGIILSVLALVPFLSVEAQNSPTIFVEPVVNNIKVGALVGNKNLAFGVGNIVQEIINEQDSLILIGAKEKAEYTVYIELIFFDIVTTNSGVAVFHRDEATTVIRMKGVLYKNGKKIKSEFAEGKSSEISTSRVLPESTSVRSKTMGLI